MLVLLVDDDDEDRELFIEALNKVDGAINSLTAKDGQEAIDLLTNGLKVQPDIIFMDVNMPLMGGRTCLELLKKNSSTKEIPVVIYSTTTNEEEIREFKKLGATEFLVKPSNFISLINAIRSFIKK